jgi:hypothetical protein
MEPKLAGFHFAFARAESQIKAINATTKSSSSWTTKPKTNNNKNAFQTRELRSSSPYAAQNFLFAYINNNNERKKARVYKVVTHRQVRSPESGTQTNTSL